MFLGIAVQDGPRVFLYIIIQYYIVHSFNSLNDPFNVIVAGQSCFLDNQPGSRHFIAWLGDCLSIGIIRKRNNSQWSVVVQHKFTILCYFCC